MSDLELWYNKPASTWTEALPIGNGRLGGMVFGDISRERLQLNESTFFTGGPYAPLNPEARESLGEVRRLIFAGQYREAEALAHKHMMAKPYLQMSFQPIGDIIISFHHQMNAPDYRRSLDLDTAIATTRYTAGKVTYTREAFVSPVAGVLVYRVSSNQPGAVNIDIGMSSPQNGDARPSEANQIAYFGHNRREQGVAGALKFGFAARVLASGGLVTNSPETIRVQRADSALVLVDAATSFRRFDDVSGDPEVLIAERLDAAAKLSYEQLRKEHVAEHKRLFGGLTLDLGHTSAADRPTDERIVNYGTSSDPALATLFTQYGRYLMISSSRPGTQPANLQGLWNEEIKPSWGSKYTTNINLEMNYWLPDPANLAECFEPLIALVEDVAETGKATAQVHYGARGWVLHHNTDLWRATGPVDGPQWGLWPMGGAWLCAQLWDHYQFSGDPKLLARIYPLMRGATEFLLDYLVESPDNGALVTVPSVSPENVHPFGSSLCAAPAMDNQIIRDLFAGVIEASTSLGVDAELRAQASAAVARLNPDRIGKEGQLQEWAEDWDLEVPEPLHRHVSHLYGVYPSWQMSRSETPEFMAAARKSLDLRGDDATGWGIGWRLNLWARLGDGERAAAVLLKLLSPDRSYPNLFDAHPPFQIDGNFGGAAGVLEMLVQSRRGHIEVLPALPLQWPTGSVRGIRARGGFVVDVSWRNSRLLSADVHGRPGQWVVLHFGALSTEVVIPANGEAQVSFAEGRFINERALQPKG
ncbi:glycoside hydrolase family 95 protein [Devosia sp.]|uniref:glycoside hydrolase family 95 protein n=1 Tax=Devosia sp. TaxID=1871048 RepID=UPI00326573E1